MSFQTLVTILLFAPLAAAAIAGLFGRRIGNVASQAVTTGALFLSCGIAWTIFSAHTWGGMANFTVDLAPFIEVGKFVSHWSIRVDALSAVMLVVVTSVSALVHLYSWGYMAEDPSKPRFFAYLSLFTFAMLALVTANAAAIKAFVVNRVGDFGFALGIMTVFWMFGTIRFDELFAALPTMAGKSWEFLGYQWSALDLAAALLFVGAMGKSAQFFLHTWLPDAMEGPTPVSALIHAATMVTAGVYMVCLLSPLFSQAPVASLLVTVTGAVTAFFAATVALTQNDIKRVIAYSTCSQLGYMFFAAGVGAYNAAMFHLFTHAFFKALLFLGAGSVIHGMHHEQDMRAMGGLRKYMGVTFAVMTIGTIAITGLGIPGIGGFAGFYSKDAIIEAAYAFGVHNQVGVFAFWMGILVAGLTAFYSWRLAFMTFEGEAKWAHGHDAHAADDHASHAQIETHSEPDTGSHDDHGHGHDHKPHESPWVMLVPLLVLAVGAIGAGFVFAPWFLGEHAGAFWNGAIAGVGHSEHAEPPEWVIWAPLVVTLLGTAVAAFFYLWKRGLPTRIAANRGPLWTFLYNKWFFDEIYDFIFVKGAKLLGDLFWKVGDQKIIDGLGPNGFAWGSLQWGKVLSKIQSGYVYHYAFVMLLGVVGLLTFAMFLAR